MVASKSVVYDKFDGGEFGTMSPFGAPNGMWTGENVVVYRNGRIGPRPGVKKLNFENSPAKDGPLLGFGFSPVAQTDNTPNFFILEDRVYLFDPVDGTNTLVAATPDLDQAPGDSVATHVLSKESVRLIGDDLYFTVNSDATYALDCRNQTLVRIDPSPDGTDIELYRDRILVASGGGVRVFYSDPADFDSWPSGNFFDVGAAYRILNMTEFRDTMCIFTQSGQWVMTGTANDGTLRRISDTLSPSEKAVVKTNDSIIYIPASRNAPVVFNGSFGDEGVLKHLENWKGSSATTYGVQSYGNRDVLFLSNSAKLLWRKNDAWTYHDIDVSGLGPWITRHFDDYVVLATPGSSSVDPTFYMLRMSLDRPAFTSDQWALPGDNSTTPLSAEFTMPDFRAPEGKEIRVRAVIVDFYKYATGSTTNNRIDVNVSSLSRENLAGNPEITKTIFDEAGTSATTSGVLTRAVYRGAPLAFGGGYRVGLSNLKGVAIERITVEIEEFGAPVT